MGLARIKPSPDSYRDSYYLSLEKSQAAVPADGILFPHHRQYLSDACYDDEGGEGGWTTYPQGEPGGGEGTTTPDSTTNPPNTLPGECGEDRNWVVYVIDTNTGEWKNPCTQEEPPIEIDIDPVDANGYFYSRKLLLDSLLNVDKFGIEPCDSLTLIAMQSFGTMYQDIAGYTPPQYVLNRLDSLRNILGSTLNFDNWNVQTLDDADGAIVNCDYFPIKINSFPINPFTNLPFTPLEFVEYFRNNINNFITPPIEITFNCDFGIPVPNTPTGVTWNDCNKFYQPYSQSLGALWHLNIPGPLGTSNDGSVIISDYKDTTYTGGSHSIYFTVSTLETPFDYEHPVAGNRRFGVFNTPANPNTWTFYTMGVDRIWDVPSEIANSLFQGFETADLLWGNVLGNLQSFIDSTGNSQYYDQYKYVARPRWEQVEKYLRKEIDLQQLKTELGC